MCDVIGCEKNGNTLVESGAIVCEDHTLPKKYVCRHCHVQVVSKNNHHPVLGKSHGKKCPRRRMLG